MPDILQNKSFIKAIAKYFMDFLETDFHKRKSPRRAIKFKNTDNLLVGVRLSKYPKFHDLAWKAINKSFDSSVIKALDRGVYQADLPGNLVDLITLQIGKVAEKDIKLLSGAIAIEAEKLTTLHKDELTKALEEVDTVLASQVSEKLASPFVGSIAKSLESLEIADENILHMMSEELTEVIVALVSTKLSDAIKLHIVGDKVNFGREISSVLTADSVKETLADFFDELKVQDLFLEVFEMERNKNILDKQDFYLYFCDITFNRNKYPIFYIPVSFERQTDSMAVTFDSQVYINKRALEYIAQEYSELTGKKGSLEHIKERIIYLSQHQEDLPTVLDKVLSELKHYFELDGGIDLSKPTSQLLRSSTARVSNDAYIALFDKSDEALINDYEEILNLEDGSELAEAYEKLLDGFINKNPISIESETDESWDNLATGDKLVSESPIPLNSEQIKILMALQNDKCSYVSVEGPPGTGKSHTITAIVFNAILENKSVLVLSDKKEALDVVEDKITQTMDEVRFDKNFQNPILRLGKSGNNYRQILLPASVEKIKLNYRAVKRGFDELESNIRKSISSLQEDIQADSLLGANIDMAEVQELSKLEEYAANNIDWIDCDELLASKDSYIELSDLRDIIGKILTNLNTETDFAGQMKALGLAAKTAITLSGLSKYAELLNAVSSTVAEVKATLSSNNTLQLISGFSKMDKSEIQLLAEFIRRFKEAKKPVIGFMFNKAGVTAIDNEFKQAFGPIFSEPHLHVQSIQVAHDTFIALDLLKDELPALSRVNFADILVKILHGDHSQQFEETAAVFMTDVEYMNSLLEKYPLSMMRSDFQPGLAIRQSKLSSVDDIEFEKAIRYISLKQKISDILASAPIYNYAESKKNIEKLVTTKMTYLMDERLIDFSDNSKADAKVLREIIKSKEKFPKEHFSKLKEAFPCILASIRDYAEYIPLDKGIFDLVIIDEASQVSIAQAFPALLRAKKALILGDRLQFGNVKAMQAKSDINLEYLNSLRNSFTKEVSNDAASLKKLEYFNIKKSILDFFEFISNYQTMLVKHFRGYKENISFSNKYFYQDHLQVMKIRAKSVDEVIKFSVIKHDGKKELRPNTNTLEVEFIIEELKKLKDKSSTVSVGVITPHTNQQKLLYETINKLPDRDYLFDNLNLKIMTFDTCQGEERDIIFYSMVATQEDDKLQHVFSKDLGVHGDDDSDDNLRRQRLNVGFSRSKECMHLVLSKSVVEYRGAIGEALNHYSTVIEEAKKEKTPDSVDQKSPMEAKVLNWFYQTEFWKKNQDSIEFIPQFEIGNYLKQLDPLYNHPAYKVDFLIVYSDESSKQHRIVLEYDGLLEHFKDVDLVDKYNSTEYYSDEDVYRQKVLESYGYKFVRINKFNIGDNPIGELDSRIGKAITNNTQQNQFLQKVSRTIEGLQNGEMKECPKCTEIKPLSSFRDTPAIWLWSVL